MNPALIVKDPQLEPASFTRFVLPFGYQLTRGGVADLGRYYRQARTPDWLHSGIMAGENAAMPTQERREYLTPETVRALFSRACWLVLEGEKPESLAVPLVSGMVNVCFRAPGLVLMEWERELERLNQLPQNSASILASGFLVLETWFPEGSGASLDDLLLWNELARYFRCPWNGHISVNNKMASALDWKQPEDYLKRWDRWLKFPVEDGSGRKLRLMPDAWLENATKVASGSQQASEQETLTHWMVHADNRCHVWTCALHEDDGLKAMSQNLAAAGVTAPPDSAPWLRLLNADKPGSSSSITPFERRWLMEHSYTRWASDEDPAIYGFTPHSGAMLTCPNRHHLPTWQHFRCLYFDQLLLMLYVRTSLFRFSERLSVLAGKAGRYQGWPEDHPDRKKCLEQLTRDFQGLRWEFAQFTNLYQFPLISHQQQAVEMYDLLRRQMVVEEFFQNVRTEIETTQTLLADLESRRQGDTTLVLTKLAFLGLLLSLAVSVLGVDSLIKIFDSSDGQNRAWSVLVFLLVFVGVFVVFLGLLILGHKVGRQEWARRRLKSWFHMDF